MNNASVISAWKAICSLVAVVEVPTLRRVIGERLVSQCEELELELNTLREILCDAGAMRLHDGGGPARLLLEQKIAMLLKSLGNNVNERDNDSRLRNYVWERRPSPVERSYHLTSALKELREYLNIDNIDLIVFDVRRLLEDDVKYMQSEIVLIHQSDAKATAPPSLVELRRYGSRLEDEWLRREHRHQVTAILSNAELNPKPTQPRPPESSSESSTHRQSPIRLARTLGPAHITPYDVVNQKQKSSKMRSILREARDEQHWQHW